MRTSSWLEKIIAKGIEWSEAAMEANSHDARGYIGAQGTWRFVIASFSIEDQGYPPGTRGYDGTATRNNGVLHLSPDEAKMLHEDAESKISP